MPGIYRGTIRNFTVREQSPHGEIYFDINQALPFNGQGPDFGVSPPNQRFVLDEDSDTSFAGMAAICARMVNEATALFPVRIIVRAGAADEIDEITIV